MRFAGALCRRLGRTVLLLALVAWGTIVLMRFAPGYFTDAREMDGRYAQGARTELQVERAARGSVWAISKGLFAGILHGDAGRSREYDVPVMELILPRLRITCLLLVQGIVYAWCVAFFAALLLGRGSGWASVPALPFTILLAIPTAALATLFLLAGTGGPVLVLTLILAARDFKFLRSLMGQAWNAPHLLQARAQGLRPHQLVRSHVFPNILPQILALASVSLVTALSAIVPVEVVFDIHGIGQLAWSAAMNRDLPVLMAITLLMATLVACAGMYSERAHLVESA